MTYSSVVGNDCNSSSSNASGNSLGFSGFRESNRISPSKPYILLSSNAAFEFFTELYTHESQLSQNFVYIYELEYSVYIDSVSFFLLVFFFYTKYGPSPWVYMMVGN